MSLMDQVNGIIKLMQSEQPNGSIDLTDKRRTIIAEALELYRQRIIQKAINTQKFKYGIDVHGGTGDEAWHEQICLKATSLGEAYDLALPKVNEMNGWIVAIEQVD